MKRHNSVPALYLRIGCLTIALSLAGSMARAIPPHQQQEQAPQQNLTATASERDAYQAAHAQQDAQAQVKMLDAFVVAYPDSTLLADVYQDYYLAYFSTANYVQAVAFADKFLSLADKDKADQAEFDSRLSALKTRAAAYSISCDSALLTPDAYREAKVAATLGLQVLSQWPKPLNLTDEQFAAAKVSSAIIFNGESETADARLKNNIPCISPPQPDPGRFDRMIEQIRQQDQSPRIR
jgi:hypothetical protein